MKPGANQILAVLVITCALGAGAWWGNHSAGTLAHQVTSPTPVANGATAPTAVNGPQTPRPRPIADTSAAPLQAGSTGAPTPAADTSKPEEIIPGGATTATVVERMWETNASKAWQVRPIPLTLPNWFITGVIQRGEQTQIIVQFDGDPQPRFLKIGDTLPGGGKLSWVRPNAIGVIMPDKRIVGVSIWPEDQSASKQPSSGPQKTAKPRR